MPGTSEHGWSALSHDQATSTGSAGIHEQFVFNAQALRPDFVEEPHAPPPQWLHAHDAFHLV
jgi:hypothetical protein